MEKRQLAGGQGPSSYYVKAPSDPGSSLGLAAVSWVWKHPCYVSLECDWMAWPRNAPFSVISYQRPTVGKEMRWPNRINGIFLKRLQPNCLETLLGPTNKFPYEPSSSIDIPIPAITPWMQLCQNSGLSILWGAVAEVFSR